MADFALIIGDVARHLLGEPNVVLSSKDELRFGAKGSLAVNLKVGTWYSHEENVGGGVIDLVKREVPGEVPMDWLKREGYVDDDTTEATFDYRDEAGRVVYQVVRTAGKKFRQRRPDAKGGWINNIRGVKRILYRLPELLGAAASGSAVYVPEGEKHCDALAALGLRATTNPGGAGKWVADYSAYLRDQDVVVLPDCDDVGRKHADQVAASLQGVAKRVRILALPDLKHKGDVVDWLRAGGTATRLEELAAAAPDWVSRGDDDGDEVPPPEFSEEALALKLAARHVGDVRYVAAWGKWYRWTGSYWRLDDVRETFNLARLVCREEAVKVNQPGLARSVASAKVRAAVLSLTCEDPRIATGADRWDVDPWLLNTPDGVVDLKTGLTRPNRAEDLMTRVTTVSPAAGADCPTWKKYLERVTDKNEELQLYLQRACGYMLTGTTYEHAMFFLYGLGANGKSTFVDAISGVLGSYHTTAAIETFTASINDRHPTELANLRGARLVSSTETEEGRWAESRIKALTGGDKVSARFMRQDFFEYTPTFKLVVFGNHKPGLRTVDDAFRRRMNLIPFIVKIPPMDRDLHLGERLRGEWGAILQWMVDGCLTWQRRGLDAPGVVVSSTDQYLEQEDTFKTWMDDCCVADGSAFTPTLWLFTSWKKWAERAGEYVGSQKRFVHRLEGAGFAADRVGTAGKDLRRGYRGLSLVPESGRGAGEEPELGGGSHF